MSGRECSFASQTPPEKLSTSHPSSHKQSINSGDDHSQDNVLLPCVTPLTTTYPSILDTPEHPKIDDHQDLSLDETVNLNHMELLIHLTTSKEIFSLGDGIGDHSFGISLALNTGLKYPYLLHPLLAFSARHLAFLHPERSPFYLHQAITLQTRAISLFNASRTEVDQSNCVAILLFSTTLGHHVLADTLAERDPGGLDVFLTHYIKCMEMHRGIHTVASTAWSLLLETELEPILSWSSGYNSRQPRGNHCQRPRELVDGANGLREEDKKSCRLMIQYLQIGFDAILTEEDEENEKEEQGNRYKMIFTWILLAPPNFTNLLAAKQPEVLVLLGYYALLLHCARSLWQVRDSGAYILGMIVDYLGPEWDYWLEYPRETVANQMIR